jgi:hypothetical protein
MATIQERSSKVVPIAARLRAIAVGLFLLALAGIFSFILPIHVLTCDRVERSRVDCQIQKRILALLPIKTVQINNLQSISITNDPADQTQLGVGSQLKTRETEDQSFLLLADREGIVTPVEVSPVNVDKVEARLNTFLNDSSQTSLSEWLVSNWKFAVIGPGFVAGLGLIFILLVLVDWSGLLKKK